MPAGIGIKEGAVKGRELERFQSQVILLFLPFGKGKEKGMTWAGPSRAQGRLKRPAAFRAAPAHSLFLLKRKRKGGRALLLFFMVEPRQHEAKGLGAQP